jgi:hypothetical protein
MGWYDDEEKTWWPAWATTPVAWIGCLAAAVLPAGVMLTLWNALLPQAPPVARLAIYILSLGLMIAAIKPWTLR